MDRYLATFTAEKSSPRVYETLYQIIHRLHDAHTGLKYGWGIVHLFAYNLVGVLENGRPLVRVAPREMHSPSQKNPAIFKADPSFYGAKVLTINGEDAWNYTRKWAFRLGGGYHNAGQQLNDAFGARLWSRDDQGNAVRDYRIGSFCARDLPLWPSRRNDYTHYPVDHFDMTVELPGGHVRRTRVAWLSAIPAETFANFSTPSALQAFFWQSQASPSNSRQHQKSPVLRPDFVEDLQQHLHLAKAPAPEPAFSRATQISEPSDFWPVFMLNDNRTAVVVITTFATDKVTTGFAQNLPNGGDIQKMAFLEETFKAFTTADSSGASQVIVDLRSNGGGTTSMGSFLVEMLMGTAALGGQTQLMIDNFRAGTEFVRLLVAKQYSRYDPARYLDMNENPFSGNDGDTFFFPLQKKTYGTHGASGVYSSNFKVAEFLRDRRSAMTLLYGENAQQIPPVLGTKPFILLSDGLCFSTCMNFAYTMRKTFGTKLVLVGGEPGNPFQLAGGGVGFILPSAKNFYNEWKGDESVASHPKAPKAFIGAIDVGMQFANGFVPGNASAPAEFSYLGADNWVMYNLRNIVDDSLIWSVAARGFEKK